MLKPICVLGGSGFVGTHLINRLNDLGYAIRVPTRSRNGAKTLWMIPRADVVECDIHDPEALGQVVAGCGAVINLVGILNERKDDGSGFKHAHEALARKVINACRASGTGRLLHMSALNAHPDAPSHYLRTKGIAENLVLNAADDALRVAVFRPSVIFGPDDGLFCRFDGLLSLAPGVLPLACAGARFAPVYVDDVVDAILHALANPRLDADRYALCGPDELTLEDIVTYLRDLTGRRRLIVPLGDGLSRLMANVLEWVPGKPLSRDNYRSTQVASVCRREQTDDAAAASILFDDIGIRPRSIDEVVPDYMLPSRHFRHYSDLRVRARRRSSLT